ncbi:MAG: carbohydrate ABC transporter permease [Anaerolineae bacterium]|nr:carbohydrate ABC transporter permease [Anaerolineae bacterium]
MSTYSASRPVSGTLTRTVIVSRLNKLWRLLTTYFLLITIAIMVILPISWIIASSFTTRETVWKNVLPFSWRAFIPEQFTLEGYVAIFEKGFGQALLNTFFLGIVTVVLSVAICAAAGFAFARLDFRGKNILFGFVVFSFMVPGDINIIPSYILISSLGWLNTWQALIVPALSSGVVIFLFRQFFSEIPQEILDAARVDGASWFQVFTRIVLPLSTPVMISASVLIFLGQWNSFFWPLLVAPVPEMRVVQVAVSIIGVEQQIYLWEQMFASTTLALLVPVLLILPFQRYYISGIMGSGVKG